MKVLLELVRIIFLFVIMGGISGFVLGQVYGSLGSNTEKYGWMGFFAIMVFCPLSKSAAI